MEPNPQPIVKKKKEKILNIAASKSAQTMFKTALRNHMDLTSIADSKASMMLQVNTMILSIGLPLLLNSLSANPMYWIPIALLAATTVLSITFATLATRPINTPGITTPAQFEKKRTNLFFFGNYYKMNYDQYNDGMEMVIKDNDMLEEAIKLDLFYVGKSLGKKYSHLRICYNVFMYGIIIAVLAFGLVHFITG